MQLSNDRIEVSLLYELIVLLILMDQPFHGYMVAKIMNDIIGPFAKASTGRIYPLLAQLEKDSLVTSTEETVGGRQQRVFRITDQGRKRFHDLMMDTGSNPKAYQELFHYKVCALHHLTPDERVYLLDHYITYCQAHILHLTNEVNEYYQYQEHYRHWGPDQVEAFLGFLRHMIHTWEVEVEWVRELRAKQGDGRP